MPASFSAARQVAPSFDTDDTLPRGILFLVCGPSGAGKDSLISGARVALEGDPRFVFPRRVITRPSGVSGENHRSVTVDTFVALSGAGAFSLEWQVHDLQYGVLREVDSMLAAGRHAVVNVSRSVLDQARKALAPVCVIAVTVDRQSLAGRLAGRGRETEQEMEKRLQRADAFTVDGKDVVTITNDGTLREATTAFVELLRGHAGRRAAVA